MGILQDYTHFLSTGGLIPYAASGLDYLRGILFPSAPQTNPRENAYIPPYSGGQCTGSYTVFFYGYLNGNIQPNPYVVYGAQGPLGTLYFAPNTGSGAPWILYLNTAAGARRVQYFNSNIGWEFRNFTITRDSGLPDNCGNMPNPQAPPPIAGDGVADSAPPNFGDPAKNEPIIDGVPYTDSGEQFGDDAQDDFSEAGTLAPTDLAGALGKIAAGLLNLAKLLSLLDEILSLLKELLGKDNKSSFRHDFGAIEKDGFLRLFPDAPPEEIEALYIDISFKEIKTGVGKQFGNKSPNLYLYEPLGRIQFVSSSFGILSDHPLIASRNSIAVPPLAYGFFYRLGLDGINKANVSGFYLKIEK